MSDPLISPFGRVVLDAMHARRELRSLREELLGIAASSLSLVERLDDPGRPDPSRPAEERHARALEDALQRLAKDPDASAWAQAAKVLQAIEDERAAEELPF